MPDIVTDNPAAVVGLVSAGLVLAAAFGLHVSADQMDAILKFIGAAILVLALVAHKTTVPKTPSSADPKLLQDPPPPAPAGPGV